MLFETINPRRPDGRCTWCEQEQTLSPVELARARAESVLDLSQLRAVLKEDH